MNEQIERFFQKNGIRTNQIVCLVREDRKTMIYMTDGQTAATALPLKEVFTALPEGDFLNIQKGIAVAAAQIKEISDTGCYIMSDGHTFQGRRRSLREHKDNRERLLSSAQASPAAPLTLLEKCTIYDNLPIAVCLIELISDADGALIDFVFRYCNARMEELEGVPLEKLLGHTIREIFPKANYRKLIAYADVALNGTHRIADSYSFVNNEPQKVYCYQPEPGYCICLLAKVSELYFH